MSGFARGSVFRFAGRGCVHGHQRDELFNRDVPLHLPYGDGRGLLLLVELDDASRAIIAEACRDNQIAGAQTQASLFQASRGCRSLIELGEFPRQLLARRLCLGFGLLRFLAGLI